ncbi:MAG: hypothetical protein GX442_02160 [Candidatus Riflebacteria bacterium]|nr:hypothetical protein [Candidatus Riflebacteria bacterium]
MNRERNWVERIWRAPVFSPMGLIVRSLVLVAFFLVCEQLGWREYTTIICGTSPTGAPLDTTMTLIGCTYFVAWSMVVLVVPVLMLAALIMRVFLGRSASAEASLSGEQPIDL